MAHQHKVDMDEIAHYHSVLNTNPRDIEAHLALCKLEERDGELKKAGAHSLIAARLLASTGRLGEALDACQRSIQLYPSDTEAHLLLANLYARRPASGHALRVVEVLERPSAQALSEPVIILGPADAVEEIQHEELDVISAEDASIAPEEDPEDVEELDSLPDDDPHKTTTVEIADPVGSMQTLNIPHATALAATIRAARQRKDKGQDPPHITELSAALNNARQREKQARVAPETKQETPRKAQPSLSKEPVTVPEIPPLRTTPRHEEEETVLLSLDEVKEELKNTPVIVEAPSSDTDDDPAVDIVLTVNKIKEVAEPSSEELELDDIHILNTSEMKALDLAHLRESSSEGDLLRDTPPTTAPIPVPAKEDTEARAYNPDMSNLDSNDGLDPHDVLQVIDASDDSFLRGHPPMLFTSGESSMSALGVVEPPSVPGIEARLSAKAAGLSSNDGFEAIADLIQDSLDASLGGQEELSGEFEALSKPELHHSHEPPVPGWSKRPPEVSEEPPQSLVDALRLANSEEEPSSKEPPPPPSGDEEIDLDVEVQASAEPLLPGDAGELLERLAPGQHERLGRWLRRRRFPAGSLALREGVPHQSLFLIESGEVVFERRIAAGRQPVATLGIGGVFGEFELLLRRPPRVQARASQDAVLVELTERALTDLSITAPGLWNELWAFYQERLVRSFLDHGSLFRSLSPQERLMLLEAFEPMVCEEGEAIIQQGNPGAGLYLISAGEVMVSHQQQERHTIVANLREGNFFCSLVQDSQTPVAASVESRGETRLMMLPREVLQALTAEQPAIREALARLVSYRQIVVGKTNYSRIGIPG